MNEKERILKMLDDGLISPAEAAKLLAALQEHNAAKNPVKVEVVTDNAKAEKPAPMAQVQMQRPDGTYYTIDVPPGLVPAFMKMAGVAIKESVRTAANDAWDGFKIMVKNKTTEVKTNVSNKVRGVGKDDKDKVKTETASALSTEQEARRRIIQMVQNGRIGADDAARLIQQLDALTADESLPRLA